MLDTNYYVDEQIDPSSVLRQNCEEQKEEGRENEMCIITLHSKRVVQFATTGYINQFSKTFLKTGTEFSNINGTDLFPS